MLHYVDRRNTHSFKWDGVKEKYRDLIAMSTADMDFKAPDCVLDALHRYVEQGTMGYYMPPDSYFEAFAAWEEREHGYRPKREWMRVTPGVVPAFFWLDKLLINEGDAVLVQTPVYAPFYDAIKNAGGRQVDCELCHKDGVWTFDPELFEQKIRDEKVALFMLCSPHNPVGRVWTEKELRTMLDICRKYGVKVLSDEIHQDLIMPGYRQVSAASLGDYSDMLITMTAASKTFNLAATQNSIVIIEEEGLRAAFDDRAHKYPLPGGNAFGYVAAQAAYLGGREWLDELNATVWDNYCLLREMLEKDMPLAEIAKLEGTYLAWIDLDPYLNGRTVPEYMLRDCHISCNAGEWFGPKFAQYVRLNLATSRENVEEAAQRMIRASKMQAPAQVRA